MKYAESASQSAELLRLVIPKIAQHGGVYTPAAYCVWYEHLAGVNPALSGALTERLRDAEALSHSVIEALHRQHVQGRDARQADELQRHLHELLGRIATLVTASGESSADFAGALEASQKTLSQTSDVRDLQLLITSLATATAAARAATDAVRDEMQASRAEMLRLREEVGTLRSEALTDPLTGLRNRRGFEQAMTNLHNPDGRGWGEAAVMLADIDYFKRVNDTRGHLVGDQVLRSTAQLLSELVKGRDIVARFGGEEFIVFLPNTPRAGALALAEQIRAAFSTIRVTRGGRHAADNEITLSIGVAVPGPGEALEQVIERADKALYVAKSAGRDCVRMAS